MTEFFCLLPLLLFLFFFTLIPILGVIGLSFSPASGGPGLTFANYSGLFSQPEFLSAFFNTLVIALTSLAIELALGLILALVLSGERRSLRFFRPIALLPLAIPTVVAGVAMRFLFSNTGWINRILHDLRLADSPVYWMSGGTRSLLMVALADAWKVTPLVMLILLAGLQSIDRSLYKAARIDGAGTWYTFRRVTLPLLLPSITAAVIIRGIDAFRIFALPLILMGENLKVIGTYSYLEYTEFNDPYASAASSVVLLLMILFAVTVYLRSVGKRGLGALS
ncbi:MAG: carbohydrate ABC transporter permease [Deltaproteobacteria bacterium]